MPVVRSFRHGRLRTHFIYSTYTLESLIVNVLKHPVILTVSTGRCGTVYLYNILKQSKNRCSILHESATAHEMKPAVYHRCFEKETQKRMREDGAIMNSIGEIARLAD